MAHSRSLLWIVGIAAGLVVLLLGCISVLIATFDVNRLIAPMQARVKAATGRDLLIGGGANLELSLYPRLVVNQVSVSNAPWAGGVPLATAKQIRVEFDLRALLSGHYKVTRVDLVEPVISLETDARGRGNWQFDTGASASNTTKQALRVSIDRLDVEKGAVAYKDGMTGAVARITIDALSLVLAGLRAPMHAELRGRIDTVPVDFEGDLGPPEVLAQRRWPYSIDIAGKIAGRDAALKAQLRVDDRTYALDPLDLTIGGHAVKGRVAIATGEGRPRLVVDASLNAFDAADLKRAGATKAAKTTQFVFPDTDVPLDALREAVADADIKLLIGRLAVTERLVLQQVLAQFTLQDGRLDVSAFKADLLGGGLTARFAVDASRARASNPGIALRATVHDLELEALLALLDVESEVHGSRVALSMDLKMHGSSPHAWASDATGSVLLSLGGGTLGNDRLDRGGPLQRLLGAINPFHSSDASTELVCAVARLPLSHGVARIDRSLAIESTKAGASASGTIDFRHETVDLSFKTGVREGISLDIARVAQLVRLQGPFRGPDVRIDAVASATTAARIGAAVGTGGLSVLGGALLQGARGRGGPCEVALGKAAP
jgi:uncharacterized protein involved in outer membrane biogenesis